MQKIISTLFLLTTLISCREVHELQKKRGMYYLGGLSTQFSSLKDVEWEAGTRKEVTISQGVRLLSTIPNLSDESKLTLRKKYGVNSWLIRVSKSERGHAHPIGHFFSPSKT